MEDNLTSADPLSYTTNRVDLEKRVSVKRCGKGINWCQRQRRDQFKQENLCKSRKVIYFNCSTNNLASTKLSLFLQAIENHGGYWPSRVRVDHGVENILICEAMVQERGEGVGALLLDHPQEIERLWRDVFRCVRSMFYYTYLCTCLLPW